MLFLLFLITELYFLILVVAAQIFDLIVDLAIPLETSANETNAEIKTQPLTA